MKSIAAELGISPSTVSRVLNGNKNFSVSRELRDKILARAGETGYTPNPMYQSMRKKDNRQIAIMLPNYLHVSMDSDIAKGVDALTNDLVAEGFSFHYLIRPLEQWKHFGLPQWKVAGVVTVDVRHPELIQELDQSGIPYVSLNGMAGTNGAEVLSDDVKNMNLAMEHLYRNGHRKIAYINMYRGPEFIPFRFNEHHYSVIRRTEAYFDFCGKKGIPPLKTAKDCNTHPLAALELALDQNFTAFITYHFGMAVQLRHELEKKGLNVPKDISLVTFNNPQLAEYVSPPMTCVEPAFREMGMAAGKLLMEQCTRKRSIAGEKLIIPGQLIERESVAECKSENNFRKQNNNHKNKEEMK